MSKILVEGVILMVNELWHGGYMSGWSESRVPTCSSLGMRL